MPAPPLSHTFESGQADTTNITVANSGVGGDAFSAISSPTIPTYSTTHAKNGTLAQKIDTTATYAEVFTAWTGLGSITTSVWFRLYVYLTAFPSGTPSSLRWITARTAANANSAFLTINSATGVLRSLNAAQSGVGSNGTVAIALNQWVRVEWRVVSSATVGESEWWLYNTADAAIASFDDHNAATGLVLGANTDGIRWGPTTVNGPNSFVYWTDDIAVSTSGQIGPSTVTTTHDANIEWLHF